MNGSRLLNIAKNLNNSYTEQIVSLNCQPIFVYNFIGTSHVMT